VTLSASPRIFELTKASQNNRGRHSNIVAAKWHLKAAKDKILGLKMSNSIEENFSTAALTPTYLLTRRHEDLNVFLKAASMGAASKKFHIPEKIVPLWRLLRKRGTGWGTPIDWSYPERNVELFLGITFQMGVAKAFSSFDKFLDDCSAELDRYNNFFDHRHKTVIDVSDSEKAQDDKLSRMYERLSLETQHVSYFFPFFQYYQELRNCIVHRAGIASRGSESAYNRIIDSNAITEWSKRTGHIGPIQIMRPEVDRTLNVQINDVLLASTTLIILSRDISSQICSRIGVDGLTFLAARSVVRDVEKESNAKWLKNKSLESAVAAFLGEYNRLGVVRSKDAQNILKRVDYFGSANKAFLAAKV